MALGDVRSPGARRSTGSSTRSRPGARTRASSSTRASSPTRREGLHKALDLGEWWLLETGLPLPLGVNVARRDLGDRLPELSAVLLDSIQAGPRQPPRGDARTRCASGAGSTRETADRFVGMYVNELTCDYGDEGRKAVEELLRRGDAIGAFPEPGPRSTTFR